MSITDPVIAARGRLGGLLRAGKPDPVAVAEARRELTTINCEAAIQRALAAAPPITADQRARLAALLTSGGSK